MSRYWYCDRDIKTDKRIFVMKQQRIRGYCVNVSFVPTDPETEKKKTDRVMSIIANATIRSLA